MKTWVDKLREMPIERLKELIHQEKNEIEIKKRDLNTMEGILIERLRGYPDVN